MVRWVCSWRCCASRPCCQPVRRSQLCYAAPGNLPFFTQPCSWPTSHQCLQPRRPGGALPGRPRLRWLAGLRQVARAVPRLRAAGLPVRPRRRVLRRHGLRRARDRLLLCVTSPLFPTLLAPGNAHTRPPPAPHPPHPHPPTARLPLHKAWLASGAPALLCAGVHISFHASDGGSVCIHSLSAFV